MSGTGQRDRTRQVGRPHGGRLRGRLRSAIQPDCGWPEQLRRIRRRVGCALAVLAVASVPVVLLALAGLPHAFREPLLRNVLASLPGGGPPAVGSPAFASTLELLTGASIAAGNRVEWLENGNGTFPRLWADLAAARRSITVQVYYAQPGKVADELSRILGERSRAGVHVYLLYDALGGRTLPASYLDRLHASGVETAAFRPARWFALDRANHRTHVRGIVIDGTVAYTGGFGIDDKWLGDGRRPGQWRETNARFVGPAVTRLQGAFVAQWAEATGTLLVGDHLLPAAADPALASQPGSAEAAVIFSPPVTGSTTAERLLALSIASARRRLYVTNAYFVPQADYVRLLVDAARRGVDVRLLTNGPRGDSRLTWLAGRSRYEPLLAGGVRIFEYEPTTLHAKTLVVDGRWCAVTTMNFDNRSLAYNSEVALVARDERLGAALERSFEQDLGHAREVRLRDFRDRGWRTRLLERGASAVAGLL